MKCYKCNIKPVVDTSILVWAFRYCLGRKTYAVNDCVENILFNWDKIPEPTMKLMVDEIQAHEKEWGLGWECDCKDWHRIINRYIGGGR